MMKTALRQYLLGLLLAPWAGVAAPGQAIEFSAHAIQQSPQGTTMDARMYVTQAAVRSEYVMDDQPVIEIVFPQAGKRVVLFPQQQTYMEQQAEGLPPSVPAGSPPDKNPCAGLPEVSCRLVGKETISGRKAEKWEFVGKQDGRTVYSLHWFDAERRLPLREFFPDGTVSELQLVDKESLGGRRTEKWQHTITRADGTEMQSFQWYDPQLQIVIREELPGGYLRELRNIRVETQDRALFEVPANYQRVTNAPAGIGGAAR